MSPTTYTGRLLSTCKRCDIYKVHVSSEQEKAMMLQTKSEHELHLRKADWSGLKNDQQIAKKKSRRSGQVNGKGTWCDAVVHGQWLDGRCWHRRAAWWTRGDAAVFGQRLGGDCWYCRASWWTWDQLQCRRSWLGARRTRPTTLCCVVFQTLAA